MNLTPEILRKKRIEKQLSQKQVADYIGVSQPIYGMYESGKRKPKHDKVEKLITLFELNISNDISKESEIVYKKSRLNYHADTLNATNIPDGTSIPYYDVDFIAGNIDGFNQQNINPEYYINFPQFSGCVAFNSHNDSMIPIINSGAVLFGREIKEWRNFLELGQIYGIVMLDGRKFLKYIKKGATNTNFLLISENKHYEPFEIPKNMIKSIWLIELVCNRRA